MTAQAEAPHAALAATAAPRVHNSVLIDRENDGVVGRIDVQPDDLPKLGRELRIARSVAPS